ncbi:MAG TPA: glycosyltransferase [Elusimicrobiota bacterium]|nr:glycosyltransferase [Elusimicrobiota bacterium]
MKTVLMLVYFFPPSSGAAAQRSRKLAKYLPKHGWQPLVVTAGDDPFVPRDNTLMEDVASTEIHRTLPSILPGMLLGRRALRLLLDRFFVPDIQVGWIPRAHSCVKKLLAGRKIDLVYTSCAPFSANLEGERIGKRYGVPWVTDFRDPWVAGTTFRPPTPAHRWIHAALEDRAFSRCDWFVANTPGFLDEERERHPVLRQKSCCISNGYDPEDFPSVRPAGGKETWEMVFTGSWHRRYYPDTLFRIVRFFLERNRTAKIKIHYSGPHFKQFFVPAERNGLAPLLEDHGHLSYKRTIALLQSGDLLLTTLPDDARARTWVPAKLYEYLATGRAVFGVCPDGDAARLVELAGSFVRPNALDAETRGGDILQGLWDDWKAGKRRETARAVLEKYQYPVLAERLAGVFDRLTEKMG